jgi:hypothetical protein
MTASVEYSSFPRSQVAAKHVENQDIWLQSPPQAPSWDASLNVDAGTPRNRSELLGVRSEYPESASWLGIWSITSRTAELHSNVHRTCRTSPIIVNSAISAVAAEKTPPPSPSEPPTAMQIVIMRQSRLAVAWNISNQSNSHDCTSVRTTVLSIGFQSQRHGIQLHRFPRLREGKQLQPAKENSSSTSGRDTNWTRLS